MPTAIVKSPYKSLQTAPVIKYFPKSSADLFQTIFNPEDIDISSSVFQDLKLHRM